MHWNVASHLQRNVWAGDSRAHFIRRHTHSVLCDAWGNSAWVNKVISNRFLAHNEFCQVREWERKRDVVVFFLYFSSSEHLFTTHDASFVQSNRKSERKMNMKSEFYLQISRVKLPQELVRMEKKLQQQQQQQQEQQQNGICLKAQTHADKHKRKRIYICRSNVEAKILFRIIYRCRRMYVCRLFT